MAICVLPHGSEEGKVFEQKYPGWRSERIEPFDSTVSVRAPGFRIPSEMWSPYPTRKWKLSRSSLLL